MQPTKITLDPETGALIQWLAGACGLTASGIVDRLLSGHLSELWELRTFMESLDGGADTDAARMGLAANLLISYGPDNAESILGGIERIAPDYATLQARFVQDVDAPLHVGKTTL